MNRIRSKHSRVCRGLIIAAGVALAGCGFCELGLAYPVSWWLYLGITIAFAAGLFRFGALRLQAVPVAVFVVVAVTIATLCFVDWTTRKPFLRDLARIRPGMSESDVRRVMGRYEEGTGWPANPFEPATTTSSLLMTADNRARYTTTNSAGEMTLRDSLIFRHSNEGRFNSDWGIILLSNGKVVSVQFSAD